MSTEVKELPKDDVINSPKHYLCPFPIKSLYKDADGNYYIDALNVIKAWGYQANAYIFNVLKYILRSGSKPGESTKKDLKKSRYYIDEAINEASDDLDVPTELIKTPGKFVA